MLLLLAIILIALAVGLHHNVVGEIRPLLPGSLQDSFYASAALYDLVWKPSVPRRAVRKFVASLFCGSAGLACIALFMFMQGSFVGAALFAAVCILSISYTTFSLYKHRSRSAGVS